MKIIALTGKAGSGKDTAARLLQFMTARYSHSHPVDINRLVEQGARLSLIELNSVYPDKSVSRFQIAKFAYPVYQIVAVLTGHESADEIMTERFKTTVWDIGGSGYTGRQLLQKVGEGMRKELDEGVWNSILARKILKSKAPGIIISDLRMLDEAAFIKGAAGIIIRIIGRETEGVPLHRSETELDHIMADYIVNNEHDLLTLAVQLQDICKRENILNCKYQWKTS